MLSNVFVLARPPADLSDLTTAFRDALPATCRVERLATPALLVARLEAVPGPTLVVLWASHGEEASSRSLIRRLRRLAPRLPVVIATGEGDVRSAARAVEAGANDFLVLVPPLLPRVRTLLGKLSELIELLGRDQRLRADNAALRATLQARYALIGESPVMRRLLARIEQVAAIPRPVLIVGERGTGKELVARAIHEASGGPDRPIVALNCAAYGDALLESELFGHERGAFTGAEQTRIGAFEQADGGTLFLDEIANMSLAFQQKILRVVEYGTYRRVGGARDLATRARIIAATNADLRDRIRDGAFLRDLYDRLSFETIEVPPLRARRGDVAVLARHFLAQFAREIPALQGKSLSDHAIAALGRYGFPGNVRELKHVIERAAVRGVEGTIGPADLGLLAADAEDVVRGAFDERVEGYKRRLLQEALDEAGGNGAEAARLLGLTYDRFRWHQRTLLGAGRSTRGPLARRRRAAAAHSETARRRARGPTT